MISPLNKALATIDIREPIKSLIRPHLSFVATPDDSVSLSVRIDTFERSSGTALRGLETRFPCTPYLCDRYLRRPIDLAAFVRRCLVDVMTHEISESLWVGDGRVFEPEHWGPSITAPAPKVPDAE